MNSHIILLLCHCFNAIHAVCDTMDKVGTRIKAVDTWVFDIE